MSDVVHFLSSKGYKVVENQGSGYCFDVFAVLPDVENMIVLKKIESVDELKKGFTEDLKKMVYVFNVTPLVIGEDLDNPKLENGIVMSKNGIPLITEETFKEMLKGEKIPLVFMSKGGIYVKINPEKLKKKREELGLSLGDVAYKLGVSRRMVFDYERGKTDVTVSMALKIEKLLGEDIFECLSVESLRTLIEKNISNKGFEDREKKNIRDKALLKVFDTFEKLGFLNFIFKKTPFKLASTKHTKRDRIIIKKISLKDLDKDENRVIFLLANLTKSKAVFIVADKESTFEILNDNVILIPSDRIEKNESIVKELVRRKQN